MTASPYDVIADWYDAWLGPDSPRDDPFFPSVEALMGPIGGQRVCDLACGQGWVARHLTDLGGRVVGIDLSTKLLAIARRHEESVPRGITYLQADAQHLNALADGVFDGVVCHMSLMDIPELNPTLGHVARLLRLDGWFIFSILHPCFNPAESGELTSSAGIVRTVRGYFTEGFWRSASRTGPPGKVGAYHRTLTTYLDALADAGLTLERVREPCASGIHAERRPVWAEVPAVLVARCRKGSSPI
jgi:SAM-dependent methyltransferase